MAAKLLFSADARTLHWCLSGWRAVARREVLGRLNHRLQRGQQSEGAWVAERAQMETRLNEQGAALEAQAQRLQTAAELQAAAVKRCQSLERALLEKNETLASKHTQVRDGAAAPAFPSPPSRAPSRAPPPRPNRASRTARALFTHTSCRRLSRSWPPPAPRAASSCKRSTPKRRCSACSSPRRPRLTANCSPPNRRNRRGRRGSAIRGDEDGEPPRDARAAGGVRGVARPFIAREGPRGKRAEAVAAADNAAAIEAELLKLSWRR